MVFFGFQVVYKINYISSNKLSSPTESEYRVQFKATKHTTIFTCCFKTVLQVKFRCQLQNELKYIVV